MKPPYGNDRAAGTKSRTNSYLSKAGYARGGRVEDEGTSINITIGAPPQGAGAGGGGAAGPALMSALAQAAKPPMGPPPMPPPGPGGPPAMPAPGGFRRGGSVGKAEGGMVRPVRGMGTYEVDAALEKGYTLGEKIKGKGTPVLNKKGETLYYLEFPVDRAGKAQGGLVGKSAKTYKDMDAGALGGVGRIEKTAIAKKAR